MRIRGGFVLVVLAVASLVACGGEEEAAKSGSGTRPAAPAAGTGGGGEPAPPAANPAQGPLDAFTRIQQAVENKDFRTLYGLLSEENRMQVDGWVEMAKKQLRDVMAKAGPAAQLAKTALEAKFGKGVGDLDSMTAEDAGAYAIEQLWGDEAPDVLEGEVRGEPVVDGDQATITVAKPDGGTEKVQMVKEGTDWALELDVRK